jgi:hypothetical protein
VGHLDATDWCHPRTRTEQIVRVPHTTWFSLCGLSRPLCGLPCQNPGTSANSFSCRGKPCAISALMLLTLLIAIQYCTCIAQSKEMLPRFPNSYSLKILPVNPYNSKICMLTLVQVHCFHRPEGEGVPCPASRGPLPLAAAKSVSAIGSSISPAQATALWSAADLGSHRKLNTSYGRKFLRDPQCPLWVNS